MVILSDMKFPNLIDPVSFNYGTNERDLPMMVVAVKQCFHVFTLMLSYASVISWNNLVLS